MTTREELVERVGLAISQAAYFVRRGGPDPVVVVADLKNMASAAIAECEKVFKTQLQTREIELLSKLEAVVCERAKLEAQCAAMRAALETIAEARDAGRHDGLPEPCPAHDAETMFAVATNALSSDAGEKMLDVVKAAQKVKEAFEQQRQVLVEGDGEPRTLERHDNRRKAEQAVDTANDRLFAALSALGWKP